MTDNPTWYDILGVPQDASAEDVKAAWRAATDKFEPGSGTSQFRLFNEAADVLLDPERRAAYDAELDRPDEAGTTVDPESSSSPPPPTPGAADSGPAVPAAPGGDSRRKQPVVAWLGDRLTWVLVIGLPLLVAAVVMAVVTVTGLHVWKADIEGIVPAVETFEAGPEATAAAERALTAVLSYDYRHMEADRDRAVTFLTPRYEKQYLKTFGLLTEGPDGAPGGAVKTKAVVTADVLNAGVVDAESDLVRVIAFVNQSSVKGEGQPAIFQNRVVATMVHQGGDWLVDNITSY